MKPRTVLPRPALACARAQGGVISRRQLLDLGVTRHGVAGLLRRGGLAELLPGTYSLDGDSWTHRAWAGVVHGGDGACLGGAAAAHLAGLCEEPEIIDVWTPTRHVRLDVPGWRFHRGFRIAVGAPPRVPVEMALIDLCAGQDADTMSSWLGTALSSRATTPARVERALSQAPSMKNRALFRELLEAAGGGAHSALEARYLRDVERAHGLPPAARQRSVQRRTRSDAVYEGYGVIVELDGRRGHVGVGQRNDGWRDARNAAAGWVTLRFAWADVVEHPCDVAAAVAETLAARGWSGSPHRCGACRLVA